MAEKRTVAVGLSGGVDSAVAAWLLKEQGYEVTGVTLNMHGTPDPDARRIAEKLNIPFEEVDCRELFETNVIADFARAYRQGETPNPCIRCNESVKFAALLAYKEAHGLSYIATGHYAHVIRMSDGRFTLKRADSDKKDQTYALYRLSQEELGTTLMPLGAYEKSEIRALAAKLELGLEEKHDSQEICFIPDNDHGRFLMEYSGNDLPPAGRFIDREGKTLGPAKSIVNYTIGQRKGLNLSMGHPVFVTELRPETGEIVIGENEDLFTSTLEAKELAFMGLAPEALPTGNALEAIAKIRYAHPGARCTVTRTGDDRISVRFSEPQRAITPGQSVVLYEDGKILLGGIIARA